MLDLDLKSLKMVLQNIPYLTCRGDEEQHVAYLTSQSRKMINNKIYLI
jgi:hypothetical protein